MAGSFNTLSDSNKDFSIFREYPDIKADGPHPEDTVPLINSDNKIIQNEKLNIRNMATLEGGNRSGSYPDAEDYQEDQESEEEIFEPKVDKLEAFQRSVRQLLAMRACQVKNVIINHKCRQEWCYLLVDQGKESQFEEEFETDKIDLPDYCKILFSGFGKNEPQNITDKISEFFCMKVFHDLFVIKEECGNVSVYHYVLIDPDKKKVFLEQSNTGVSLVRKVKSCGRILYSGLGQDPPEIISDRIIEAYFSTLKGKLKRMLAKLKVNRTNKNGWTSLHDAAYIGNVQVMKNLIDEGADLLAKDAVCGRMPVHIAGREGHNDILKMLLSKHINVNEVDEKDWTPLHYAAWGGHLRTVKLLIKEGADIHATEATAGKKAIHIAAGRGYISLVNFFLRYEECVDVIDKDGCTVLFYAASGGHLEVVKSLAERGADMHSESILDGFKPIHFAASSGCKKVVEYLLDGGANVNDSSKENCTTLHFAAVLGHLEVVKLLIKRGANIDAICDQGATPAELARERGHTEISGFLDGLK